MSENELLKSTNKVKISNKDGVGLLDEWDNGWRAKRYMHSSLEDFAEFCQEKILEREGQFKSAMNVQKIFFEEEIIPNKILEAREEERVEVGKRISFQYDINAYDKRIKASAVRERDEYWADKILELDNTLDEVDRRSFWQKLVADAEKSKKELGKE